MRLLPLLVLTALATAGPAAAQVTMGEGKTISAVEGTGFSGVVASFPNATCTSPCTATIDWGDGTPISDGTVDAKRDVSGHHTYAEEGKYTTQITLKASNGNPTAGGTANVADAPLTATGLSFNVAVGDAFNGPVATFTDADPGGVASDYAVAIDWGDGSLSAGTVTDHAGGGFDALGSHSYASPGTKTVAVTVTDAGGASAMATGTATVAAGSGAPAATTPAIITGLGNGGSPNVRVFSLQGSLLSSFFAYDAAVTGGVRVAAGDFNGDKRADIVTGAGPGGGPHVKIFNGVQGNLLSSFFAYDASFQGGVYVAAGDVNGDGVPDVITGADAGGPPHVKVFNGVQGNLLQSFLAYGPGFTGGVRVAAGDVNGDGRADVITGAGAGPGGHVKVFSGMQGDLLQSFFAFNTAFTGGVRVAGGDVNGDGRADVIAGAGPGGGPHVMAFTGNGGSPLAQYDAFSPSFTGGVFVAVGAGFVATVQRFTLTRSVFRVAAFPTPRVAAAIPRGTVFRYVLNGSGKVRIAIARKVPGRKVRKRCVAPNNRNAGARGCARYVRVATLRRSGKRGANAVRFSGRIGTRALPPGRYRATILTSPKVPPRHVSFTIVPG